jgi:glycerol kinase
MASKKKKGNKTKAPSTTPIPEGGPAVPEGASASTTAASTNEAIKVDIFPNVMQEDITESAGTSTTTDNKNGFVGAIDQGTSSTRFLLFTARTGRIAASAQMEHAQYYPQSGWHEHDPLALWHNTVACMAAVTTALSQQANVTLDSNNCAAIGITNQRETVVAWNRITGEPYYPAIVWDDTRTSDIAAQLNQSTASASLLTSVTGLPVSSYFAGTKVKWLLDHVDALRVDMAERPETVCFGTVDTWLLYQLTGTCRATTTTTAINAVVYNTGGVFRTDVTNASRWLFMALESCQWDPACIDTVCAPHNVPLCTLPTICPSAYYHSSSDDDDSAPSSENCCFGVIHESCGAGMPAALASVPITAMFGDQQAALFGQAAHTAGHAKNTYGTGLFLMMNTGTAIVPSQHGLLTTVAYQIGSHGAVHYALEGSVSHSGATIQWLRDQLGIISSASESESLAHTTESNDGLYFCPAFAGLFAPRWRSDARGCIVGMTAAHHKGHVCRAALEAAAFQTKEVFDAIIQDSGCELLSLKVDGGGTNNKLLMQFQADIINVPVVKPVVMETTAMGAAFGAGLAVGVWKDLDEIQKLWAVAETFEPSMSAELRETNVKGWNKAVTKSLGWIDDPDTSENISQPVPIEEKAVSDTVNDRSTSTTIMLAATASVALAVGVVLGGMRRKN